MQAWHRIRASPGIERNVAPGSSSRWQQPLISNSAVEADILRLCLGLSGFGFRRDNLFGSSRLGLYRALRVFAYWDVKAGCTQEGAKGLGPGPQLAHQGQRPASRQAGLCARLEAGKRKPTAGYICTYIYIGVLHG